MRILIRLALFAIIMLLFGAISYGQNASPILGNGTNLQINYNKGGGADDSMTAIPVRRGYIRSGDTLYKNYRMKGRIRVDSDSSRFYYHNGLVDVRVLDTKDTVLILATKSDVAGANIDTTSLSNRINQRVKYTDTSAMLSPYLRKADTASLSIRIDARVKYADTAAMLASYQHALGYIPLNKADSVAGGYYPYSSNPKSYLVAADISNKVSYADTNTVIATKQNLKDTATSIRSAIVGLSAIYAPLTRNINTTSPLSGGGSLAADRTISISQSNTSTDGYLSSTDWNTFNNSIDPADTAAITNRATLQRVTNNGNTTTNGVAIGNSTATTGVQLEVSNFNTTLPGTVSVIANTTVTGTGTTFTKTFEKGQSITINGATRTIQAIASDVSMTATAAWPGTFSGTYTITPKNGLSVYQNGTVHVGNYFVPIAGTAIGVSMSDSGFATSQVKRQLYLEPRYWSNATSTASNIAYTAFPTLTSQNTGNWTASSGGLVGLQVRPTIESGATGTLTVAVGVLGSFTANAMTTTDYFSLVAQKHAGVGTVSRTTGLIMPVLDGSVDNTYICLGCGTGTSPQGVSGLNTIFSRSTYNSYFAGRIGIGDSTPAAGITVGNGDLIQLDTNGQASFTRNGTSENSLNVGLSGTTARLIMGVGNGVVSSSGRLYINFSQTGSPDNNSATITSNSGNLLFTNIGSQNQVSFSGTGSTTPIFTVGNTNTQPWKFAHIAHFQGGGLTTAADFMTLYYSPSLNSNITYTSGTTTFRTCIATPRINTSGTHTGNIEGFVYEPNEVAVAAGTVQIAFRANNTTGYGFYVGGTALSNYVAGNLGIGDATPSAALTVGAGDLFQVNSSGQIVKYDNTTPLSNRALVGDGTKLALTTISTVATTGSLNDLSLAVDTTSLTSFSPVIGHTYEFIGAGIATWPLPVLTGNADKLITLINASAFVLNITSNNGVSNDIFNTTLTNTVAIPAGGAVTFINIKTLHWKTY